MFEPTRKLSKELTNLLVRTLVASKEIFLKFLEVAPLNSLAHIVDELDDEKDIMNCG